MKLKNFLTLSFVTAAVMILLMYLFGQDIDHSTFAEDTGFLHYFWKLPDPTLMSRLTSWGGYILHQITAWYIFYKAQREKTTWSDRVGKYGIAMALTHLVFTIYHLIQTQIWYDGIAQEVPIWVSQGSVILMLVSAMIFLNQRRGIFFGKKLKLPEGLEKFEMKYHGYFILWALILTFWYHPMDPTAAHLTGFFYMFLLFIQSAMIYSKGHINSLVIFICEFGVLIHGTIVALQQQNQIWPMFTFGFGVMAIVTQIYLFKSKILKWAAFAIFAISAIYVYGMGGFNSGKTIVDANEIIRIPVIEYGLVLGFAILFSIWNLFTKRRNEE